jgi:lipopolysaccharide biosynthesis protein
MPFPKLLKDIYWAFPLLNEKQKDTIFYKVKEIVRHEGVKSLQPQSGIMSDYIHQILGIPTAVSKDFKSITEQPFRRESNDPKLIAYYLPQMHPTPENNAWWGRGVTEWNNVSRAVPQFVGHYQPRLPGELGFYDLRLKENLQRQIELAKMYGIYGFSWYYYWFDGKRLLDRPLDMFLSDCSLDFPFCLCWANESWTKGFFGSSKEVIMKQSETEESYKNFIHDAVHYLKDKRYITIRGKKLLIVYKPHSVPNCSNVLAYWREYCQKNGIGDLYILGCWTGDEKNDILNLGFDAETEFQPGSLHPFNGKINQDLPFVNNKFIGEVYSYKKIVEEKFYKRNFMSERMYNSVMPMWDNTPRRNNHGNRIFHGSSPALYKIWLKDIIAHYHNDCKLDDNIIFINAWNEWGEGAYLEPDRFYGYAYLEATKEAIEEQRL